MLPPTIRQFPFEVVVAGYQETSRRGIEPITAIIIKIAGNSSFRIERPERDWLTGEKFGVLATPEGYVSNNELSELVDRLESVSIDATENMLVANIRSVASRNSNRVGTHCMSVLLPSNGKGPIRIRFIPNAIHIAVFSNQKTKHSLPVAFSPWIIGPENIFAPSIVVGKSQIDMGPHEIILEAPNPENGIIGYMGAQPRPSNP